MKFSLIVAVVVLALAQGSFAQDVGNLEGAGQYLEEMKNKMAQELTQILRNPEFANQAQNIQTQLEPLATQIQEQIKTVAANVEEQMRPMFDKLQKQIEAILQTITDQARPVSN
ncbi:type-4 ice-structuring protein LS-12-like [Chelmon rostratus]|uniref:type-4 ice-structuring protein LS-12-like n=1 Tax=Chelmon rostratus TaxID=109905 RepID=UPI001BE8734C|nr:type-4 ice-structuring protein LS-12-like [Chelmon rostratus]